MEGKFAVMQIMRSVNINTGTDLYTIALVYIDNRYHQHVKETGRHTLEAGTPGLQEVICFVDDMPWIYQNDEDMEDPQKASAFNRVTRAFATIAEVMNELQDQE